MASTSLVVSSPTSSLEDLADQIRHSAERLQLGYRRTLDEAITLGRLLAQAKAQLPASQSWRRWVKANLPLSRQQADKYIALSKAEAEGLLAHSASETPVGIERAARSLSRARGSLATESPAESVGRFIGTMFDSPDRRAGKALASYFRRLLVALDDDYADGWPTDGTDVARLLTLALGNGAARALGESIRRNGQWLVDLSQEMTRQTGG